MDKYVASPIIPGEHPQTAIYTQAVNKLLLKIEKAGHSHAQIGSITLTKRYNGQTGPHIHATAKVTIRFDESVSEIQ